MKLYLECNMGAAGDMLLAAIYELLEDKPAFLAGLRALGLPGVEFTPERSVKCGVAGTHMRVTVRGGDEPPGDDHAHSHAISHDYAHNHAVSHDYAHNHTVSHDHAHSHAVSHDHAHHHTVSHTEKRFSRGEIADIIASLRVSERVKSDALAVYGLLAAAEAKVHGADADTVHFHEVGALDAVADIVGVCLAVEALGAAEITASPVAVGSGFVRCEHGILPVPAPAVAELLLGIPTRSGDVRGELCTPTGAALLRHFVTKFGAADGAAVKIGYGMGTKDFDRLNAVRAILTEDFGRDEVLEMSCNIDDMTAEAIGFAAEELLAHGALDVFMTPVYMKKSRPATILTVLCRAGEESRFTRLLFRYTTTLGVRFSRRERAVLDRRVETRATRHGDVRVKIAEGYGVTREKIEYEDAARIARETGGALHGITLPDA